MKQLIKLPLAILLFFAIISAQQKGTKLMSKELLEVATLGGGCFWCVEAVYESVNGVTEVINGYAGGYTENPTYQLSNTGRTGHAEAVEVLYDPTIVRFQALLAMFWESHNPTQGMRQGNDMGTQYRSAIYCSSAEQLDQALGSASVVQDKLRIHLLQN